MSLKEKTLLEINKYQLKIDVDKATFDAAVNTVYRKQAKNITIPGFRRGKAPRAIIEKMYGKSVFYEDAVNEVLPDAYEQAAKESELDIVGRPEFDIDTIDENGVVITAVVFVKPEVKIEGYKGIKATKPDTKVTDDEVNAELENVRERNARMSDITDRAAQNGDIANIDFEGFADGKAFEGGKAEGHEITLGSHSFIDTFEEQIVGKNIGEEFDVNVTFPEDYHEESLKGKPAVFKVKLNSLKVKELPALDDELATLASEFDTLDEYKENIKATLTERKEHSADHEIEHQITDALVDLVEADIPECMFDEETENCLRDMDNNLRMQGLDLKTYLQYTGMDLDAARDNLRPRAIEQVKTRLALEKIAELENIEVAEEEIEEEYKKLSEAYGISVDEIKNIAPVDGIKTDISLRKAFDAVKAEAKITKKAAKKTAKKAEGEDADKKDGVKKPAAKKTAAKKTAAKATDEKEAKPSAKKTEKETAAKAEKEEAEG